MDQPWSVVRQVLVQGFSHLIITKLMLVITSPDYIRTEENPLKAYIYRYTMYHRMVTGMEPDNNTDPSSWLKFLGSITNAHLTEKILGGNQLPRNLGECMRRGCST